MPPQKTKKRQAQHGAEPLWWISSAVPAAWAAQVQVRPDHARSPSITAQHAIIKATMPSSHLRRWPKAIEEC
jgi:hypothetical protein